MKLQELLAEGAYIVKNKDGKEKRFKDAESPEAKAWKSSSSPAKRKGPEKYSFDWWDEQDVDTLPWDAITELGNFWAGDIKKELGREPDDITFGGKYTKEIDGVPVAARKVRLLYAYTKDDDLGIDDSDGPVEDSVWIGVHRDLKDPEKLVFDGYK